MHAVIKELLTQRPVVTDGAWATQLQELGLPVGACPDAWNLVHPERVEALACAYVEAGSRVILTNTFGANRVALARHGLADEAPAINRAGVAISRRAAGDRARVFASMGPTGVMLATDDVSEQEMERAFEEQAAALAESGADAVVIETMSDLDEARIAVRAARKTELPVIVCMAFDAGRGRDRTLTGVTPEQAAEALAIAGAAGLGANCGNGPAGLLTVCERLRSLTGLPLWIKPNAGLPEWVGGRAVYRTSPEQFAAEAAALVRAGADFVGGCCGTSPAFIRALLTALGRSPEP